LLATIITTTPGTVSCIVDEERRLIWVHALDCDATCGEMATADQAAL
jgi:multisubunit Na+/H+ antiporter MnhE subunit